MLFDFCYVKQFFCAYAVVVCLCSMKNPKPGELEFKTGDIIEVLEKRSTITFETKISPLSSLERLCFFFACGLMSCLVCWFRSRSWYGSLNGKEGLFATELVAIVNKPSASSKTASPSGSKNNSPTAHRRSSLSREPSSSSSSSLLVPPPLPPLSDSVESLPEIGGRSKQHRIGGSASSSPASSSRLSSSATAVNFSASANAVLFSSNNDGDGAAAAVVDDDDDDEEPPPPPPTSLNPSELKKARKLQTLDDSMTRRQSLPAAVSTLMSSSPHKSSSKSLNSFAESHKHFASMPTFEDNLKIIADIDKVMSGALDAESATSSRLTPVVGTHRRNSTSPTRDNSATGKAPNPLRRLSASGDQWTRAVAPNIDDIKNQHYLQRRLSAPTGGDHDAAADDAPKRSSTTANKGDLHRRTLIAKELLTTEKTFVDGLTIINELYYEPLQTIQPPIISLSDSSKIFS
jgi:hypothetical protein